MLTVCCVQAGNYLDRGQLYVERLARGVARHLKTPYRFICFTDDPEPYAAGIEQHPLPHPGLVGWMNKIALFKPNVFAAGERVLYLDLDTLITGSLDDIARDSLSGKLTMLEDLLFPKQLGSGVMVWRAGCVGQIWQHYVDAGYPAHVPNGDQGFIARHTDHVGRLQDIYPNQIASYKVSGGVLAPQTRIVCFHGLPRPHDITEGWVPYFWQGTPATGGER